MRLKFSSIVTVADIKLKEYNVKFSNVTFQVNGKDVEHPEMYSLLADYLSEPFTVKRSNNDEIELYLNRNHTLLSTNVQRGFVTLFDVNFAQLKLNESDYETTEECIYGVCKTKYRVYSNKES
ncbi:hypothetical protein B4U80_14073 [Leptotrombidium deliense]|uniref:Vitellogenin domain-containing protein n=1 Tax=Leptotrombidium deliense TaxID=299467 RepID=A0A443S3I1_9ACAR|nr:hypothetical protein B4U80_14073 [Leptotrombidium deliense]